jgi:hypothetical protein
MAENGAERILVELEPEQPPAVGRAVAGLLAGEQSDAATAWWRAGIADALAGRGAVWPASAPGQSGVGAAPLRKSRGTDRP